MATEPAQSTHPYQTSSQPLIGKGWIQGVALVMIFGFLVMGILAYAPIRRQCQCRTRWSANPVMCCSPEPTLPGDRSSTRRADSWSMDLCWATAPT
jgi:hypothetical protein